MSDHPGWSRRRWLRVVGAGLAGGVAGCTGRGGTNERSLAATDDVPCADDFRVTAEAARIELGTVPRVRLRLHNTGDVRIEYGITVIFQQGTSLGIDTRTGRTTLSGTLDPGESVRRTATDDARDIQNTGSYELSVSLSCLSPLTRPAPD